MLTLTVDPAVLAKLKSAMPMTDKAERAMDKYITVLTRKLEDSLMNMDSNMFKFFKQFLVSTHALSLEVGQFRFGGKKLYLHSWLEKNGCALIEVITPGLKGSDPSTIKLTKLVTMTDGMDINTLRKKNINELDQLLNDPSLTDVDLFYRVFPDFGTMTEAQLESAYDLCPVKTRSLKQYMVWLTHRANHITQVERQMMLRQAQVILRIANAGDNLLPMKKNPSHFGRNYYHGINIQSVHRTLRHAILGDCYEYDMRSSVLSWKMGFAKHCYQSLKSPKPFDEVFGATLAYFDDKKAFREYVCGETFGSDSNIAIDVQIDIIKQALTALSFGARMNQHGWIDQSGKKFNPAIVSIIKNQDARRRFIACDVIQQFRNEQKILDEFIFKIFTRSDASLLNDPELQTKSGRVSKSKIMAYLYQHAETIVMDMVRDELGQRGKEVIANVHDAIFVRTKVSRYERDMIEYRIRDVTGTKYWYLDE